MRRAENYCRFVGILQELKLYEVENEYSFCRGKIYLPTEIESLGQHIKVIASGELAKRLDSYYRSVEVAWITAIGSYMPSVFKGNLQDTFQLAAFTVE